MKWAALYKKKTFACLEQSYMFWEILQYLFKHVKGSKSLS